MNAIHVIAIVAGALASALPKIEAGLPASWAPWLGGLQAFLTLVVTVLVPLTPQAKGLPMAAKAAGLVFVVWLFGSSAAACVNGAPTPQTVQDVTIGLNAAVCVFGTYSADISAGKGEVVAIADCVVKCGVTAAQASGLLDAHKKAEVSEGVVPKPAAKP